LGVLLLDAVTTAAILFAVASGLMIILGVMKLINFAHGAFLTIGGYAALVVTQLGWNAWLAAPFAAVVGLVLVRRRGRAGARGADRAPRHPPAVRAPARRHPRHLGARHRHRPADHDRLRPRGAVRGKPGERRDPISRPVVFALPPAPGRSRGCARRRARGAALLHPVRADRARGDHERGSGARSASTATRCASSRSASARRSRAWRAP
jgi:hypothetical protein